MKTKIKIAIIPIAIIVILIMSYFGFKAWWGDVHTVLYNVKSITAYDKIDTEGIYEFKIHATVRNWPGDKEVKEYYLDGPNPLGGTDYSGMGVEYPPKLTVTGKESEFVFTFIIRPKNVNDETLKINNRKDVENFLYDVRFAAKNEEGLYTEDAHELFMNDFRHIKVDWKESLQND